MSAEPDLSPLHHKATIACLYNKTAAPSVSPSSPGSEFFSLQHDLPSISDDDLDSWFSSEYNEIMGAPSSRRSQLTVLNVVFCGVSMMALLDSGCTEHCMLDIDAIKRTDCSMMGQLKGLPAPSMTVGDGRSVPTFWCSKTTLSACGYRSEVNPVVMPLGKKFDLVLGKAYLEEIERSSQPDSFRVSFIDNSVSFTLLPKFALKQIKHRREFTIRPGIGSLDTIIAPHLTDGKFNALMATHAEIKDSMDQAKMIMVTGSGDVLETKEGDNYVPCNIMRHGVYNSAMTNVDTQDNLSSTFCASDGTIILPQPPAKPPDADSLKTNEDIVKEAVSNQNPADITVPPEDPEWSPQLPNPHDDFSDSDFFQRIKHGANTEEKLLERAKQCGVPFVDLLRDHGQIFRDDVPSRMVPSRGVWDAELLFADPQDAKRPISLKSYRLSPEETRALSLILRDMLLRGTIKPSSSPWGAPVFLVPKSDGGWRLCCDYRLLNSKLVHEAYSLPAADQLFDLFKDAKFFSTHDCTWGYHQLRWKKKSIPYTAIKTHLGTFEFLVMNFGPTSSPSQWQRLVEAILRPVLGEFAIIFLDDLCVFSKTAEDHAVHLRKVYRLLAKNRIYLRFSKCFFFNTQFKFLGWIIKDGTLGTDPEKIKVLKEWPVPTSKREVRSFTGFCNFYRKLVKNFSEILAPLFDLQKDEIPDKEASFAQHWTARHTAAFETAKEALTTAPVISIVDPALPYLLHPDASQTAVGGVLEQELQLQTTAVIAYLSKRLSSTQEHYAPGKLELLAIIVCLQHWRHYLLGCKGGFTIYTDHEPLLAIKTTKNPSRMLLRWMYFIEQFNFKVKHIKGTDQKGDMLSRPPASGSSDELPLTLSEDDPSDDIIPSLTALASSSLPSDIDEPLHTDVLNKIRQSYQSDDLAKAIFKEPQKFTGKFRVINGLIFYVKSGRPKLLLPDALPELRQKTFDIAHSHPTGGHFGNKRTLMKVQRSYFWPSMREDIEQWVRDCNICLTSKRLTLAQPVGLPHEVPHECWEVMFMDETSGFPPSEGYDAIWIFVCKLSKMAHFVPVKKLGLTSAKLATLFFQHVFRLHGMPRIIVSDRDRLIDTEFWQTLMKKAGSVSLMSTPQHPQTDSTGEATVRTCVDICRRFVNSNQNDWYELLPALEFAYNDTPTETGFSPFEINLTRHPRSTQSLLTDEALREGAPPGPAADSVATLRKHGNIIREVRVHLQQTAARVAEPAPVVHKRHRLERFIVDDLVFLHRSRAGVSFPQNKMAKLWVGPFTVVKIVSAVAYELNLPLSMRVNRVVNIRFLRRALPGQREDIVSGPPEEPDQRICEEDLKIISLSVYTDEDNITDLLATTPFGTYTVHELCKRQHFPEVLAYVSSPAVRQHALPYNLARRCRYRFFDTTVEGIVTAFDPEDDARAFQVDFDDVTLSLWSARAQLSFVQRPAAVHASLINELHRAPQLRPLRVLELCSGPHASFSSTVRDQFPNAYTVTLDINDSFAPTIVSDITTWNYSKHFAKGFFDIIWASPPCDQYSAAKTTGDERNLEYADSVASAVLKVLDTAKPAVWFIENPRGYLQHRDFMQPLSALKNECSYCMYGTDYRKVTDIWSNVKCNLRCCSAATPCANAAKYGRHPRVAQTGPSQQGQPGIPSSEANHVPGLLTQHLLAQASIELMKQSYDGVSFFEKGQAGTVMEDSFEDSD